MHVLIELLLEEPDRRICESGARGDGAALQVCRGGGCAGGACRRHPHSGEEDTAGGERESSQDTALGGEALGDSRIATDGSGVQAVPGAPGWVRSKDQGEGKGETEAALEGVEELPLSLSSSSSFHTLLLLDSKLHREKWKGSSKIV